MEQRRITDDILVSGQQSRERLQRLPEEGIRSVINLRSGKTESILLDPQEEKVVVESAGMHYIHVPLSASAVTEETVDTVSDHLANAEKPLLIHCFDGHLATRLALLYAVAQHALSLSDALQAAEALNVAWDPPELRELLLSLEPTP